MKKIYKFVLAGSGKSYAKVVEVPMHVGAKIVSVGNQLEKICIWAEVETTVPTENRIFQIVTTGDLLEQTGGFDPKFVGTVILKGGTAVAHVYELTVPAPPAEPELV